MQAPAETKAIKLPEKEKIEAPAMRKVAEVPVKAEAKLEAPEQKKVAKIEAPVQKEAETAEQLPEAGRPLPENYEAKAPKEGMQPVVTPKVAMVPRKQKADKAQMAQEEAAYYEDVEGKPVKTFRDLMQIKARNLKVSI